MCALSTFLASGEYIDESNIAIVRTRGIQISIKYPSISYLIEFTYDYHMVTAECENYSINIFSCVNNNKIYKNMVWIVTI